MNTHIPANIHTNAMSNTPTAQEAACDRLAQSRERLRQALRSKPSPQGTARPATSGSATAWIGGLMAKPGVNLIAQALKAVVQPTAQRHPLGLVLGSLVVGGLLAWSRPWRWILTPALLASVMPQLVSKLMGRIQPLSLVTLLARVMQRPADQPPSR